MSVPKFNQSELFKRPVLQRQLTFDALTTCEETTTISPTNEVETIQESNFFHPAAPSNPAPTFRRRNRISSIESWDSRYSMQSLNVSSSTVVEEFPIARRASTT